MSIVDHALVEVELLLLKLDRLRTLDVRAALLSVIEDRGSPRALFRRFLAALAAKAPETVAANLPGRFLFRPYEVWMASNATAARLRGAEGVPDREYLGFVPSAEGPRIDLHCPTILDALAALGGAPLLSW